MEDKNNNLTINVPQSQINLDKLLEMNSKMIDVINNQLIIINQTLEMLDESLSSLEPLGMEGVD